MKLEIALSASAAKDERVVVRIDARTWLTGTVQRSGPSSIRIAMDNDEQITVPKIKFGTIHTIPSKTAKHALPLSEYEVESLKTAYREQLRAARYDYYQKTSGGVIYGQWMKSNDSDLFLPHMPADVNVSRVFELLYIEAFEQGAGVGSILMKNFLESDVAKSATVIILEPGGTVVHSDNSKASISNRIKFYTHFGFTGNEKLMWRER